VAHSGISPLQSLRTGASFNATSLSFGNQSVGTRVTKTVTLKNTGFTTLSLTGMTVTGTNAASLARLSRSVAIVVLSDDRVEIGQSSRRHETRLITPYVVPHVNVAFGSVEVPAENSVIARFGPPYTCPPWKMMTKVSTLLNQLGSG
jgi:hypothetical protein